MKKYKFFIALILIVLMSVTLSDRISAQTSTSSGSPSLQTEQILKDKMILEINRRLTTLTNLEKRIQEVKKLSETNKTTLVSQVSDQTNNLNSLKVKIQAESDATALKDDRLTINAEYRIFLLFIPKMQILATSDRIMLITTDMDSLLAKLQTRINSIRQSGKDTSALQTAADNIKAKIADANTQAKAAADEVTPLVPDNGDQAKFTSNKQALTDARKKLVVARQDLAASLQQFDVIRQMLNPSLKTSSPSATK